MLLFSRDGAVVANDGILYCTTKSGTLVYIYSPFFPCKRNVASNEYLQHMFLWRNKKNNLLGAVGEGVLKKCIIWSYVEINHICDQHRPRAARASVKSDQGLCWSLRECFIHKQCIV